MSDYGSGGTPPQWLGDLPDPADDAAVAALVDTLEYDATALEPGDRLTELRAATTARRDRRPWLVAAAACTALLAAAGGVAVALNGSSPQLSPPTGRSTDASTAPTVTGPQPSGTPATSSQSPSASSSGGHAVAYALPVYYVEQDGDGLRLVREWHRRTLTSPSQRLQRALDEATDPTKVQDAGHSAPWQPRSQPLSLEGPADGLLTIDLPASEGEGHGRTPAQAELAAQQLVWTATAVQQDASMGVRILIAGSPGLLFGSLPVGDAMFRDPAVGPTTAPSSPTNEPSGQPSGEPTGQQSGDLVAIDLPRPQESLTSPLTLRGRACVFEAALSWQLLSGSDVVQSGQVTASSACPDTGSWSVRLTDVPAGEYTFRAYALPASGSGDAVQDTVAFTVR